MGLAGALRRDVEQCPIFDFQMAIELELSHCNHWRSLAESNRSLHRERVPPAFAAVRGRSKRVQLFNRISEKLVRSCPLLFTPGCWTFAGHEPQIEPVCNLAWGADGSLNQRRFA
jgi:hypothetical protein